MNKQILTGFISLLFFTTLIWSLNLNFHIVDASWLEVFGGVSIGFMIGASLLVKKNE